MSRGLMTLRADIERDLATGTDAYGQPAVPAFQSHLVNQPCWVWSTQRRVVEGGRKTVMVEDWRALFPIEADVAAGDRITAVKDRLGNTKHVGTFELQTIQPKHRHVEAGLERLT